MIEQSPTYDELLQQNIELRQELEEMKVRRVAVWSLLAETNRRLQISSASIKAAVSSLLNYDIFWDGANQHEFLEIIDSSVDQAGRLVTLLTLAFRLEGKTLVLNRQPQSLGEILTRVQASGAAKFPGLRLEISQPFEGSLVCVDYEYLLIAFDFLFEVFERMGVHQTHIDVGLQDGAQGWSLVMAGLTPDVVNQIASMLNPGEEPAMGKLFSPEFVLRLYIAIQLFSAHEVVIETALNPAGQPSLRLNFPPL